MRKKVCLCVTFLLLFISARVTGDKDKNHWKQVLWNNGIHSLSEQENPYQLLVSIINDLETDDEKANTESVLNEIFTSVLTASQHPNKTEIVKKIEPPKVEDPPNDPINHLSPVFHAISSGIQQVKNITGSVIPELISKSGNNEDELTLDLPVIGELITKVVTNLTQQNTDLILNGLKSLKSENNPLALLKNMFTKNNKSNDMDPTKHIFSIFANNNDDEEVLDELRKKKEVNKSAERFGNIWGADNNNKNVENEGLKKISLRSLSEDTNENSISHLRKFAEALKNRTEKVFKINGDTVDDNIKLVHKIDKEELNKDDKIFVIDTDCTSDDALAILMVIGARKKLAGITVVAGKTSLENATINVYRVLKTAGKLEIPVWQGAIEGLSGKIKPDTHYGIDGFGDFSKYFPPMNFTKPEDASNVLVDLVRKYPGKVTLISLGPLTNIALATIKDTTFLTNLGELYILGSSIGKVLSPREFNIYADPTAARIVLKEAESAKNKITILPFEVSEKTSLSLKVRKALGKPKTAVWRLLNRAEIDLDSIHYWVPYPAMLTALSLGHVNFSSAPLSIEVDIDQCGPTRGRLVYGSEEENKKIQVVDSLNKTEFVRSVQRCLDF